MQVIRTKYIGATNHKSSKIMARTTSGITRFYFYNHEMTAQGNHLYCAQKLARELGWPGKYYAGDLDASTYVWVRETAAQFEEMFS